MSVLSQEIVPTAKQLVVSEEGLRWLEEHESFRASIALFAETKIKPESCFEDDMPFVGMGSNANVYSIGSVAIKVVTPTTGSEAYKRGPHMRHENMLRQSNFMTALGEHLRDHDDIFVPEQYFALSVGSNRYIRGEQLMEGWVSPNEAATKLDLNNEDKLEMRFMIKDRLQTVFGHTFLKRLLDLGLDESGSNVPNVLVSSNFTDPSSDDLCIIDQPSFDTPVIKGGWFDRRLMSLHITRLKAGV